MSLTWGQGFDMRLQYKSMPSVATMDTAPIITGGGDASVAISFAQHKFDLARSFSLNSSVSAKYFTADGTVHFGMVDNQTINQNTLNFTYVCRRNFGITRYMPTGLSAMLTNYVNSRRDKMSCTALQQAVAENFGTHFVSGVRKEAQVIAIYTFSFDSQSRAQSWAASLDASYGNGVGSGKFHTDVKSMLDTHDTSISMSYQLYTTDPVTPWPIAQSGSITNYQQFQDFTTALEQYSQSLPAERAQPVAYVVEDVKNIPGFWALLDCDPSTAELADYDLFLKTYAKFRGWEDLLGGWTSDTRRMSWLNANGQQMVIEMRKDVTAYRKALDQMVKGHFNKGTPLEVSDELLNYLVQLNHIPLPNITIAQITTTESSGYVIWCWFGYVYAGPKDVTIASPFMSVPMVSNGSLVHDPDSIMINPAAIYWNTNDFAAQLQIMHDGGVEMSRFADAIRNGPIWPTLIAMSDTNRIGFFYFKTAIWLHTPTKVDQWALALPNPIGEYVDVLNINSVRNTPAMQSLEGSRSAAVSVVLKNDPVQAVVGNAFDYVFGVTNSGPGAAYGITATMPMNAGCELASIGGSQGAGVYTNGQVTYLVGSLANGAEASIRLRVIPLKDGQNRIGEQVGAGIGAGLTNISSNTSNALGFFSVQPPRLNITRVLGTPKVTWTSDTSRLLIEQTPSLRANSIWSTVTNGIESQGSSKAIPLTNATPAGFFRLRVN